MMEEINNFENNEKRLKEICEKLENENCTISEISKLYEEGAQKLKECYDYLNQYKGKITKIVQTIDGYKEEDM